MIAVYGLESWAISLIAAISNRFLGLLIAKDTMLRSKNHADAIAATFRDDVDAMPQIIRYRGLIADEAY